MPDETKIIIEIVPAANAERKIRKVLKKAMTDLEMSVSNSSLKAVSKQIQSKVKPNLTFGLTQTSAAQLRRQIQSRIGIINVKVKADTQNIKGDIQNKIGKLDLKVNARSLRQIKTLFDKVSPTKFKFDAQTRASATRFVSKVQAHFARSPIVVPVKFSTKGVGQVRQDVKAEASLAKQNAALDKNVQKTKTARLAVDKLDKSQRRAASSAGTFAERLGFTTTRLAAYLLPAAAIFRISQSFDKARQSVVAINRDLIRLTQIMGGSASEAGRIADEVLEIGVRFNKSGQELLSITTLLAQSGAKFSGTNLTKAIEGIAKSDLGATFGNIQNTTTGVIAALNQFNLAGSETADILDTVNELSKTFAVQSGDIFTAVRAGGASFKAAGGDFKEFAALVTTLSQLTQLPASTIGTGISTLSIRTLRQESLRLIENIVSGKGGSIRDAEGNLKSFTDVMISLGQATRDLNRESRIELVERIAKIRQSKLFTPLLIDIAKNADDSVYLRALEKSKDAIGSLNKDAAIGLQRLDKILEGIGARFDQVFGDISKSQGITQLAQQFAVLAKGAASFVEIIAPILPALLKLATIKFALAIPSIGREFKKGALGLGLGGFRPGSSAAVNADVTATNANTAAVNRLTTTISSRSSGGTVGGSRIVQNRAQFRANLATDQAKLDKINSRLVQTQNERQRLVQRGRALRAKGTNVQLTDNDRIRATTLQGQFNRDAILSTDKANIARNKINQRIPERQADAKFERNKESLRLLKENSIRARIDAANKNLVPNIRQLSKETEKLSRERKILAKQVRQQSGRLSAAHSAEAASRTLGGRTKAFGSSVASTVGAGARRVGQIGAAVAPFVALAGASSVIDSIAQSFSSKIKDTLNIKSIDELKDTIASNRANQIKASTTGGASTGLLTGGIIGLQVGGPIGAIIGAGIGAILSAGVGYFIGKHKGNVQAIQSLADAAGATTDIKSFMDRIQLLEQESTRQQGEGQGFFTQLKRNIFGEARNLTPEIGDESLIRRRSISLLKEGIVSEPIRRGNLLKPSDVQGDAATKQEFVQSDLINAFLTAAVSTASQQAGGPRGDAEQQQFMNRLLQSITDEEGKVDPTLLDELKKIQKRTDRVIKALSSLDSSLLSQKAALTRNTQSLAESNVIAINGNTQRSRFIDATLGGVASPLGDQDAAAGALQIRDQILATRGPVDIAGVSTFESTLLKDAIILDDVIKKLATSLQTGLGGVDRFIDADKTVLPIRLNKLFNEIFDFPTLSKGLSGQGVEQLTDIRRQFVKTVTEDPRQFEADPASFVEKFARGLSGQTLLQNRLNAVITRQQTLINRSNKEYVTFIQLQKTQANLQKKAIILTTQEIERSKLLGATRGDVLSGLRGQTAGAGRTGQNITGISRFITNLTQDPTRTSDSIDDALARADIENKIRTAQAALTTELEKAAQTTGLLQKQFSLLSSEVDLQVRSVQSQSTASFKDLTLSKIAVEQLRSIAAGQAGSLRGGARGVLSLSEDRLRQLNSQFSGLANTPLLIQTLQRAQLQGTSTIGDVEVSDIISAVKLLAGPIDGILRAQKAQEALRDTGQAIGGLARTELAALQHIDETNKKVLDVNNAIKETLERMSKKIFERDVNADFEKILAQLTEDLGRQQRAAGKSSVDIDMDIDITGFEALGKSKATKLIVIGILNAFADKLNSNPQERQFAEKLRSVIKTFESNDEAKDK